MKQTPVGGQQLKWTQSGGSLVWPRESSGRHRRYCILRLLVHQSSFTGLTQTWSRRRDLWSIPSYVCREERAVVCRTVLMGWELNRPLSCRHWTAQRSC